MTTIIKIKFNVVEIGCDLSISYHQKKKKKNVGKIKNNLSKVLYENCKLYITQFLVQLKLNT